MNRSWTHKNIARSIQFGGIYPVYEGGFIHRRLNTEESRPGFLSGDVDLNLRQGGGAPVTRGGSWRNIRDIAISWAVPFSAGSSNVHTGELLIYFKGYQYEMFTVPFNYHIHSVAINKDFLIAIFTMGSFPAPTPTNVYMRKYTSPMQGGWPKQFSDILQDEMHVPLGFSLGYSRTGSAGFTQDGRTFAIKNTSAGYDIFRFSSDFSSYSTTSIVIPDRATSYGISALVDRLGFSVLTRDAGSGSAFHYKILHIQPVWALGADPYEDEPTSWGASSVVDNLLPQSGVAPFVNVHLIYSDTSGIHVYSRYDSSVRTSADFLHEIILILDGVTHVLSRITGINSQYLEDYFMGGLARPGTNLLYIRWGYPTYTNTNSGPAIREVHIDLKTRQFTFHDNARQVPLGLTIM